LPGDQVAGLPGGDLTTWLPDNPGGWPGCRVIRWPGDQVAG